MTNIKRGLSQVTRNSKHGDEPHTSKSKKNKSQSDQKVTNVPPKAKETQETRPKKSTPKRKKSERTSLTSIAIKKKDIEQHKNRTVSATPKPDKESRKRNSRDIVLKTSARSNSTIRNNRPESRMRDKSKDGNVKRQQASEGKMSPEKLQQYLTYISAKLGKGKPEVVSKSRQSNSFKPSDVFGTITYKTKAHELPKKSSFATMKKQSATTAKCDKTPIVNKPVTNKSASVKPTKVITPKQTSKVSPTNNSVVTSATKPETIQEPQLAKPAAKVTGQRATAQKIVVPQPEVVKTIPPKVISPVIKVTKPAATKEADLAVVPPTRRSPPTSPRRNANRGDSVRSSKSHSPVSRESFSKINSLQERSSSGSKYKRMKYQTGEELLKFYKDRVERAIRDKKTFTVCGNFWSVRKALLTRGWVEKIHSYSQPDRDMLKKLMGQTLNELIEGVADKNYGALYKRVIMSKLLGRHQVDLFWDFGFDAFRVNPDNVKLTIINCIRRGLCSYSTKEGLCAIVKRSHWYNFPGIANLRHPRSYTLTDNGEPEEFIRDFRITACMSILKWIITTVDGTPGKVISEAGKVPVKNFHFALNECEKFLQRLNHEDIDTPIISPPEYEWNSFLENYYKCVHIGNHFKTSDMENEQSLLHKSKIMLNKLKKSYSCLDMDGYMNIWILKPTGGSRGIGIHICRTLAYVLRVVGERKTTKYVIQKYIERPLLIYNTKFDIRQWFLISSTNPLTIWMYNMCYLRFSSQTYNLRKLHESIHLTNNSVQCKYKNTNRDPALPEHNMWDSIRFKDYLQTIGYPDAYEKIIYPGMKQCVTAAVLIQQEYISTRKNCFELYGADFMITEDFQPWLLEINSRPALYASTPITGRLCPQVLEDVIKVIVDHARNPKANTGRFELLYQEQLQNLPSIDTSSLTIRGIPLSKDYFLSPATSVAAGAAGNKLCAKISSLDFININNAQHYMMYVSKQMKQTLRTLLDVISKERERRNKKQQVHPKSTSPKMATTNTLTSPKKSCMTPSDCMPYVIEMTNINDNLNEIKEIFAPQFTSENLLDDLHNTLHTNFSQSITSIRKKVVDTETEFDNKVNTKEESEMTSFQDVAEVSCSPRKLSKAEHEAINKHSEQLERAISELPKNRRDKGGFLEELVNYLTFWRTLSHNKYITSEPLSPEGGWSRMNTAESD